MKASAMREYAKVGSQFWIGETGKALREQGAEALIVAMYLMTAPTANMLGLYYLTVDSIGKETGLGLEGASKGLRRAIDAGFCAYDHKSEVVWVFEMARFQIAESLDPRDKRCRGIQNEYDGIPKNPFLSSFYDKYGVPFHMTRRRPPAASAQAPSKGHPSPLQDPSMPHRSQEQEQEQAQEQEQEQAQRVASPSATIIEFAPATSAPLAMRENPPLSEDPAIQIAVLLKRAGINANAVHPTVQAWATQKVELRFITAALEVAQQRKPNEAIPVAYLAPIVAEMMRKGCQPGQGGADKFQLGSIDRSGDVALAQQGAARNGIEVPAGKVTL